MCNVRNEQLNYFSTLYFKDKTGEERVFFAS